MSAQGPLAQLLQGVRADLGDYARLHELLEAQFEAALRHQSARLGELAEQISGLAATLELRRQQRVVLAAELLGAGTRPNVAAIEPLLPPQSGATLREWWSSLEQSVRDCKALNARNCRLMMDQHEIMQRVLHPEADLYAPA
ncbi:flagellar protein FlgN [Aquabacterium sp. A7-Y]|uniref:flagellar export chaperone FlgN n=1 Tax=Aquabacterium sp. A7-Y TaxID=1349605 RepID=UPI00223D9965|nr:flagellar export chaperone FlgN [Aquabacterium sp. A7-Y]MCW7536532.1 flagellar protein FlgN [Aquabacterium sp. A7-Y]